MMHTSKAELTALASEHDRPSISIYVATDPADDRKSQIQFRNLLREANDALAAWGLGEKQRQPLLAPLTSLGEDFDFWLHQDAGLAVFRSSQRFSTHRLPMAVENLCIVGERFHVAPLFAFHSANRNYHILALTLHGVHLFAADRFSIEKRELTGPLRWEDAVGYDYEEKSLQLHRMRPNRTADVGVRGAGPTHPLFHGHGEGRDDRKVEIRHWLEILRRHVEHAVEPDRPIVLAGSAYVTSTFRALTDLPIYDEVIHGAKESLSESRLHCDSWAIVERDINQERQGLKDQLARARREGRAALRPPDIVLAATDGRVDTLLLKHRAHLWGTVQPAERSVRSFESPRPHCEDLLDYAAAQTFLNGGRVVLLEDFWLPTSEPVAAILRY